MVYLPSGSFQMGSKDDQSNEKPVHKVTIKQFSMGQTEVTWNMYQPCIDAGACPDNTSDGGDNGWGKGNRPVVEVSWDDITQHYIPWLNKKTGQHYRLPSEAEWEYAARAGSSTKYSWGDSISCSQADYNNTNCNSAGTSPVKSYAKNAYGLYDMHGNVWEWVEDKYHDNYNGSPKDGSAWTSGSSTYRVLRGGSWLNFADGLRSAYRNWYDATVRVDDFGFRLAQDQK